MKLKFRKVLSSIGSLAKKDYYSFDITEEQKTEAMKRDWKNPLCVIDESGEPIALYHNSHNDIAKRKLCVRLFTSYYVFEEGLGEHLSVKTFDNAIRCKCGQIFMNSKKITAQERFDKHLAEVKKWESEE